MWYAIMGEDADGSLPQRTAARTAHLERLKFLQGQGRLLLAGPFPAVDCMDSDTAGFSGSLIVAEFASLEAAKIWADADPYVTAGVYAKVVVKPFQKVLPT